MEEGLIAGIVADIGWFRENYRDSAGKLYTWKEATAWSRKRKEANRPKRDRSGRTSRRSEPASAVVKKPKPKKEKAKKPKLIGKKRATRTKELARLAGVVLALADKPGPAGPAQLEVSSTAAAVPYATGNSNARRAPNPLCTRTRP